MNCQAKKGFGSGPTKSKVCICGCVWTCSACAHLLAAELTCKCLAITAFATQVQCICSHAQC